jgi:hypothetical protein
MKYCRVIAHTQPHDDCYILNVAAGDLNDPQSDIIIIDHYYAYWRNRKWVVALERSGQLILYETPTP